MVLPTLPLLAGMGLPALAGAMGVGMVFLHAGVSKVLHRDVLAGVVANYRLVPVALVAPVAHALPFVELAIGAALLLGGQRIAVLPAATLLIVFAGAMAINIRRGRRAIDCGCGRWQLRQTLSWGLVWRNLGLAAILLPRLLPSDATDLLATAVALAGGAGLFLITMLFTAIGTLRASPLAVKRS